MNAPGNGGHPATLTLVTSENPARLSKGFTLDADGSLRKINGGQMVRGASEVRTIEGLADFAQILIGLTPAQAIVYGTPKGGGGRILSRRAFAEAGRPQDATTRTNSTFAWPAGGGLMMLDHDPKSEPIDRDALVRALREAAPALAEAALLWWASAGSCIWRDDIELRGIRGQRVWMLVVDAADIPRAGRALVDRLWLAGHGHYEVGAAGQLLERTLVDAGCWQPSRLDFAGGAECGAGLQQRRGAPIVLGGHVELIDTREAIPDLTEAERGRLREMRLTGREAVKVEAARARGAWVEARVAEMTPTDAAPDAKARAEEIVHRALDGDVLAGDFRLLVELDGQLRLVTVGQLLDSPAMYHGAPARDPVEPDYDGGRLVGKLFLLQARPALHSFAHNGRTFRLHRAPARIELVQGETAAATEATIERLRRDPVVFDFGGQLALVDNGQAHPLCEHRLANHLGNTIRFWRARKVGDVVVEGAADPPVPLIKQALALGERRGLKPLAAVVTGPTLRLDGSVLNAPGYDPSTRRLFDPMGAEPPDVPLRPSKAQARAALDTLTRPFAAFPFVDAAARGAMLAALLTAAVRPVLPTSPAFAFDAPVQGSGKTLLAQCVGALIEGRAPDIWPHVAGRDDEETRKRLFTMLRSGSRALIWDNVIGAFGSASLAAFLTADALVDRVLGRSESLRIPNRALLLITGNNLLLAGDLPRRVLVCRIDPQTDRPFARRFALDPLAHVLDNRVEMLTAACTLMRARISGSIKPADGRLASFEAWDDLVRQTVVWTDAALEPGAYGDPMHLIAEAQAEDPEADGLHAMLDALRVRFGSAEFSAKDVRAAVRSSVCDTELESVIHDVGGDNALKSVRSLGRVLKFREGRIVHGLRLTSRRDSNAGAMVYRVRS